MTYGPYLLADSIRDFVGKRKLRELPTCPPDRSRTKRPGSFAWEHDLDGTKPTGPKKLFLHHAAHFAITRWTNLHFADDVLAGPPKNAFSADFHGP